MIYRALRAGARGYVVTDVSDSELIGAIHYRSHAIERATVLLDGSYIHYGQYPMPFKILITALTALAPLP